MREECKNFKGRKCDICNGQADLPLDVINGYRKNWGLQELSGSMLQKEQKSRLRPASKRTSCSSCGKKKRIKTFSEAVKNFVLDGAQLTSKEELKNRESVCESCPFLNGQMCNDCGCLLPAKRRMRLEQCPVGKWLPDLHDRRPIKDCIKNLMMHVYPLKDNDVWKWNIQQIGERIDLFNGKIIIAVATDKENTHNFDLVFQEFQKNNIHVDKYINIENDKSLREVATFIPMLTCLKSTNSQEVTFSCHTKGVTHDIDSLPVEWAETMYHVCLDDWYSVKNALECYSMVGAFRRFGDFDRPENNKWHYSGTFYWFRNDDVFSRDWQSIDKEWIGTEAWPGRMFKPEECACIFMDESKDLYREENWKYIRDRLYMWDKSRYDTD